ncbi:ABC transporter ATP-binding protein [Bacillus carboniphilus]|uniref:ABC transporter ATP-binding protein n=1 Tax=Bacillus carboniphilus TaxID=86663 RepID=A0ABP3GFC9_9BACI
MNVISCKGLTKQYGLKRALHDVSFTITENKITGLIGRNGAGKTTLLQILAGHIHHSSGEVNVFGENPFNSLKVSTNMIFIDDSMNLPPSLSLIEILETARSFYPNWDMELAERLLDYFSFSPDMSHSGLSKGMRSTFNMILGLAARCPLTIFDEPTTGMDSSVRKDFYRALLKDFIEHPRTIILSSHLLGEVENLLEDILLIKEGEKVFHMAVPELKEFAIGIRGSDELVTKWTKNKNVLSRQKISDHVSYVVIENDLTDSDTQEMRRLGLNLSAVELDDLCSYLTSKTKGGIDDVFNRN